MDIHIIRILAVAISVAVSNYAACNHNLFLELQSARSECASGLVNPLRPREKFVAHDLFHSCAGAASGEYVIAAVDRMNVASPGQTFDRISGLQFQQTNTGLPARKYEYHSHAACDNGFQLGAEIIGKANTQTAGYVAQR